MEIWTVLLDVVFLLGAGAVLGALLERLGQSAIIGYLLAGALLGPNALHLIRSQGEVIAVSELGVALLLFAIGLEFSWGRLRGMGRVALGSGVLQVVGTTAVTAGVAMACGLPASTAVALGGIVALSSTASVLRILTSRGEIESVRAQRALGILLVQDMAVVPLVLIVGLLAEGGDSSEFLSGLARTAGVALALVLGLVLVFHQLVPRFLRAAPVHANRELPLLVAIVSGLGSGVVAHTAGISPALGAFVAGMVLAESPFAIQVRADVSSLKTLLLTLFFTAVGMLADPVWIWNHLPLVLGALVVVIIGKALLVHISLRLLRVRGNSALATGFCLAQVGEFSFVLADIARGRLLDEDLFLLVVSVTVLTMMLTPYLVAFAPRLAARLNRRSIPDGLREEAGQGEELAEVVIVIGFGPAGRTAAERIAELRGRVVVVDQNPESTRAARELGYATVTGDALQPEVLEHAHLARATSVVVTLPAAEDVLQLVRELRISAPDTRLLVRARFHRSMADLLAAGAHAVVDEEHEVGRQMALAYEQLQESAAPAAGDSA